MKAIRVLGVAIVAVWSLAMFMACSEPAPESEVGTVINRSYQGAQSSLGMGFGSKGDVVLVPNYDGEKWFVVVSVGDWMGPVETSKEMWARCTNGAVVQLVYRERIVDVR